ncbi:hypothetical protein OIU77_005973 [Salix suchowensis]|uniref:Uncharacterized protein n=1 Tax=Salix suchowensis TaxID=1278906 RepID=A0ABQ9AR96_9ROSI|nr:hypothetical protein OIU77_005973 [Salix suchowensis]
MREPGSVAGADQSTGKVSSRGLMSALLGVPQKKWQMLASSRKANQLSCGIIQGQEGTPNVDLDVETCVEEEGSSKLSGSHVSTEGDEATTTSPAVKKKKSGRKKKGPRGL